MFKRLFFLVLSPVLAIAQDVVFDGTMVQQVPTSNFDGPMVLSAPDAKHIQAISLLKAVVSDKFTQRLLKQMTHKSAIQFTSGDEAVAEHIDLGMEAVPVLNQGIHGSCVTFAATAALDAILKKGDYVSQLCSLQLGRYLQNYGYLASGWQGGLGATVLNQLDAYGFMSKDMQRQYGCGGLTEYPHLQNDLGEEMSLVDFHQYSESLVQNRIAWSNYIDFFQMMNDGISGNEVLRQVKKTLNQGDRLIFAVLLADYEKGLAGAVGSYKVFNDTWLITPEIVNDLRQNPQFAGHEMLIIGYDDEAIAKDDHGRTHQGLLKLRNSWGERIGDHGDFYMSYDYFKALVVELQRVRKISPKS